MAPRIERALTTPHTYHDNYAARTTGSHYYNQMVNIKASTSLKNVDVVSGFIDWILLLRSCPT